ncbi:MAG: hypothetical protein E7357_05140 [Clostridiales bacterium]|nr:hypothetical protein [Clostridiales bacterium]
MRVGFVCKNTLGAYKKAQNERADGEENPSVLLFGFNGLGEVAYERELKGETRCFEDVATLSKQQKCVVVCGCITNARGHKRKSAIVAEQGRLIGVSDALHAVDGDVASGATLRVYDTSVGKMGVVVADDLAFPETLKSLAVCGSDFIVCPFGRVAPVHSSLVRAYGYCFGVPIFFCGDGVCMIADVSGDLAFSSSQSPAAFDFEIAKEYHLVQTRQRGFYGL